MSWRSSGSTSTAPDGARPDSARPSGSRPSFRPDVQGLRALAVGLVVLDHLGGLGVPGGFVGVDVFFVVSGYLITGLLLREVADSGRVSLSGFYARRARRILPAATLVSVVTVGVSLAVLPLLAARDAAVDAVWTAAFAANVRFALVGDDYFAQGAPPSPLQHYWSLAVEEQFYLVWPLLVVLALAVGARLARRRGGTPRTGWRPSPLLLAVPLVVLAAASLAWSAHTTAVSPTTAYFSTLARAWELAVGAGCALLAARGLLPGRRASRELAGLVGLLAVVGSALVLDPRAPFPGVVALVPVLGTALLILGGGASVGATTTDRVLAWRPLRALGDWSYSIYLWHWPLIVLTGAWLGGGGLSLPVKALLAATAVGLGALTYVTVETPFRRARPWRRPRPALLLYPVSLLLVVASAGGARAVVDDQLGGGGDVPAIEVAAGSGAAGGDRHVALVRASVQAALDGDPVPSDLRPALLDLEDAIAPLGECDYRTGTRALCPEGDPTAERTIVLIGDSHARALSPAVEEIGRREGYRVLTLVYSGCMTTGAVQVERTVGEPWQECEDFKRWVTGTIGDLAPDLVVVSTHAGQLVDPATGETLSAGGTPEAYRPVLQEGYRQAFAELTARADRVAIVGGTPRLSADPSACLTRRGVDLGDCALSADRRPAALDRASFEAARSSGVEVVDARRWFCADGTCPAVVGSYVTMRDREHMTPEYARWLAAPLAAALGLAPPSGS